MSRLPHPRLTRIWNVVASDPDQAHDLAHRFDLHPVTARILCSRGLADPGEAEAWLQPSLSRLADPFALPGMRPAVERLWKAILDGERIAIFGDYDVDGITSTALMVGVLSRLGVAAMPILPLRMEEGYGLSVEALARCIEAVNPTLIVTVDCGTGSVEAVKRAAEQGIDVIVTDHHQPGPEIAPAVAVVNPRLSDDTSAHVLAGVGVAFKLAHALLKHGKALGRVDAAVAASLREELDLVAVGTIADIVPVTGENRILVQAGFKRLQTTVRPGFRALKQVAGIQGEIGTYEVGFLIGPRLNAAGRLGDALLALELLLTRDDARAAELARDLDEENRQRQAIEKEVAEAIVTRLDPDYDPAQVFGVVEVGEGWHPGVIGIVASRLTARYHRPSVVISMDADGRGRGSCRSIAGFDVVAALGDCAHHLVKHGGHTMAAGLEITAEKIPAFIEAFTRSARERMASVSPDPVQRIDAVVTVADCTLRLLDDLDRLRPFGVDFSTPVFALRGVTVQGSPREVGRGHLKFRVQQDGQSLDAIAFNFAERGLPDRPFDLAFTLKRDTYGAIPKVQLNVIDIQAAFSA